MIEAEFEEGGRRYRVQVHSEPEQACHCGVSDWYPDHPVRASLADTLEAPDGELLVYADVEIYCGACGARTTRHLLTTPAK